MCTSKVKNEHQKIGEVWKGIQHNRGIGKVHGGIAMKSAEQIKGAVKNIATKMNLGRKRKQVNLQVFFLC